DIEAVIRGLKAQLVGGIQVGGPDIARSLTDLGLIDEYRLYFRPVVLCRGKPFFAGRRPPLRLMVSDLIGEGAIRLTYVPASSPNSPDGLRRRVRCPCVRGISVRQICSTESGDRHARRFCALYHRL